MEKLLIVFPFRWSETLRVRLTVINKASHKKHPQQDDLGTGKSE